MLPASEHARLGFALSSTDAKEQMQESQISIACFAYHKGIKSDGRQLYEW